MIEFPAAHSTDLETSSRGLRPPLHHALRDGEWWRDIPAYSEVDSEDFHDHRWQERHSVQDATRLAAHVGELAPSGFCEDLSRGLSRSAMTVRISPYLLSLIDWTDPYRDPIRRQFLPVASMALPDHPAVHLDALAERRDSPVPGLTRRYPDRVLFLALDVCPVYCRFCTRSYLVGSDTDAVAKDTLHISRSRWRAAFAYIASHRDVEDVVVSGGDAYRLKAGLLGEVCDALLDIPHVRRMRIATKGLAVLPQKILTDTAWTDALCHAVDRGRRSGKAVCLHTHFNSPHEITAVTRAALDLLLARGVTVRNQSVLIRGVNDDPEEMALLIRRLAYVNVQPYYVYVHDLVPSAEDMRTTLATARSIEKQVRGRTAGFNTPLFVVDTPGGGGKRDVHSFEYYDTETGVSVFTAPGIKPGRMFVHYDPIDLLPASGRARWAELGNHELILKEALEAAQSTPC